MYTILRNFGKSLSFHYTKTKKSNFIPYTLSFFLVAENASQKDRDFIKERSVTKYLTLAEDAIKTGDLASAELHLVDAVKCDRIETVGVSCAYDMLATLAFRQGDVAKAEKILIHVIKKFDSLGLPENHKTVIDFRLKLARVQQELGKKDLAEQSFKKCVEQKDCFKTEQEYIKLWINSLFWYAKFLVDSKRYVEAKDCFQNAYNLAAQGEIDPEQAIVMLYNLGEMEFAVGNDEEALKCFTSAIIIGKATKSSELAHFYNKIGLVYLHRGIYEEAKRWCDIGKNECKGRQDADIKKESESCLKEVMKFRTSQLNNNNINSI